MTRWRSAVVFGAGALAPVALVVLVALQAPRDIAPSMVGEQAQDLGVEANPLAVPRPRSDPSTYAIIYERPLFNNGRQADPKPQAAVQVVESPLPPFDAGHYRLVGVVTGEGAKTAIIERTATKTAQRFSIGDDLDGWRIIEVSPVRVQLQRGEEKQDLAFPRLH